MRYVGFTDDPGFPILTEFLRYKLVLAGTLEDPRFAEGRAGSNPGGWGVPGLRRFFEISERTPSGDSPAQGWGHKSAPQLTGRLFKRPH